jgi:hypothetical protein
MKKVIFQKAVYLGGLPGDKGGYAGRLMVDDEGISVGQFSSPGKGGPVKWDEISGVSFDTQTAAKSRVGKALLVGLLALAAKNSQNQAVLTVQKKDGNVTLYEVTGKSGQELRAKIQPFLIEHGVECLDDNPQGAGGDSPSTADELTKLASLHASGSLTDEEFTAAKAALLDSE